MRHQSVICLTIWAVGVLQTEAGFVTFSHLGPIDGQQIIVGEHLNAVVVPEGWSSMARLIHEESQEKLYKVMKGKIPPDVYLKYSHHISCFAVAKASETHNNCKNTSGQMDQFGVAPSLITEPFPEQTLPKTESQTMCLLVGEVVIGLWLGETPSCASRFGTRNHNR